MPINLLFELVAGEADLIGVDDDDVIAAIQIRRVIRLVLADQNSRHSRRHAAQYQSGSVHDKPSAALFDLFGLPTPGYIRAHVLSHTFPSVVKRQE